MVDILPYQPELKNSFLKEHSQILAVASDQVADVQHVGSTSVPHLDAKPIIDIAIAIGNEAIFYGEDLRPGPGAFSCSFVYFVGKKIVYQE